MKTQAVTTEAVKSFLSKYRIQQEKARKKFVSCYEAGQAASKKIKPNVSDESDPSEEKEPLSAAAKEQHGLLSLPQLTKEEASSHLGASLGYLMGLLITLEQQLVAQRAATQLSSIRKASVGMAMARMHSVREHVRQITGEMTGTVSTAPSTATVTTAPTPPPNENMDHHHHIEESLNDTSEPSSPTTARARLMLQRHGSIDISRFDGLETENDEENIFSFLNSI